MRDRTAWLAVLGVLLLLAGVPAPGSAQEEDGERELRARVEREPREPRTHGFDTRLTLGIEYDDNARHLRDDAIEEFELGLADPERYRIDSVEDWILLPEVRFGYFSTPESRRTTRVRAGVRLYRHNKDTILDYERFGFLFEQDLTDSRKDLEEVKLLRDELSPAHFRMRRRFLLENRTRLRAYYYYVPDQYGGMITDDDGGGRVEARNDRDSWGLEWQQRLNAAPRHRYRLDLGYRNDRRDYNWQLEERDSTTDRYRVELNYYGLQSRFYWQLAPGYELSERRSNTGLIGLEGPEGTIEDDVSYDRDLYSLVVGFYWNRTENGVPVRRSDGIRLLVTYAETEYLTQNAEDLDRFGRNDDFWSLGFEYFHTLQDDLKLTLYAQHTEKDTNLDPLEGIDRSEPGPYDNFVVGFKLDYYLDWRSRGR